MPTLQSFITMLRESYQELTRVHQPVDTPIKFKMSDWKDALKETKNAMTDKNLSMLAAGIAYYGTLAFFPLIAAVVAISAFVISHAQLQSIVSSMRQYLPSDIASLLVTQLQNASGKHAANIIVAVVAILVSLFSVSGAIQNAIRAANVSYGLEETRKFIKLRLISLGFTLALLIEGAIVVALIIVNSSFLDGFGIPHSISIILISIRWILLVVVVALSLALFYRFGPNHTVFKWQWVSWGAVIATIVWLLGTILFFVYAQYFSSFSKSYSLFAGIIVLMIWLNLSSLIVLLGAQINHSLEKRTVKPTSRSQQ